MDANGNLTSVDTYDSDFTLEEIEEQTKRHFEDITMILDKDNVVDIIVSKDEYEKILNSKVLRVCCEDNDYIGYCITAYIEEEIED